jgi:hypothetical protein
MVGPDYTGGGLVNLVAALERRLTGEAVFEGLRDEIARRIPEADGYLLVILDGLGDEQLAHPAAAALAGARVAAIDAPFPTTTTVSLATIATGMPPAAHGLLGYQLWLPETDLVVNTIKWTTLWGEKVPADHGSFLPSPNMWERLTAAGVEAVVVQPANFEGSPLTQTLYRGARIEGYHDEIEAVDVAVSTSRPGRLTVLYIPHVDYAAHTFGQDSEHYTAAMSIASSFWSRIAVRLPKGIVAVGTADHGHVDVPPEHRAVIPKADHDDRIFYGDPRVMFVRGDGESLEGDLPATWIPMADMEEWWGPGPRHPDFAARAPDGVLVADEGHSLLHRFSDDRLIGAHGGLTDAERRVPVLVADGG